MSTPHSGPYGMGSKRGPHQGRTLGQQATDSMPMSGDDGSTPDSQGQDADVTDAPTHTEPAPVLSAEELRERQLNQQRAAAELDKLDAQRKHAPATAIIPWFWSLPGLKYHVLHRMMHKLDQVPEVGRRQRPYANLELIEREICFYLANLRFCVAFINQVGGSGKSFTSSLIGQYIAWITKQSPLLMPGTRSTDTAATGDYTHIPPEKAISISRFYRLATRLPIDELANLIPKTALGLSVITHDPEGSVGDAASTISADDFIKRLEDAKKISKLVLLDLGNDTVSRNAVVTNSARAADVLVFVGTPGKPLSLDKLVSNIGKLMTDPTDKSVVVTKTSTQRRQGRQISTEEKARNSLILITGCEPDQGPKDYATYSRRPLDPDRRTTTDIGWTGVLLTLPKLKALKKQPKKLTVDPRKLTLTERLALANIVVAICRLAAQAQGFPYVFDPENPAPLSRLLSTMDDDQLVSYTGHDPSQSSGSGTVSNIASHRPPNQPATG